MAKLETPIPSDSGISDAELELAIAQEAVKELTKSLDDRSLAVNQLTQELNNALERIEVLSQNADSSSGLEEVAGLQMEIETLRAELDQAKRESFSNPQESTEMAQIQEELRNAVAQSFELQMELEQTQAKLSEMDSMLAKQPEGSLDEFIAKANQAEQETAAC